MPDHAKPPARRDHLWVLVIIAACALLEVFPTWVSIGAASGFPVIRGLPADWTLAVVVEAYWSYALYAWLVAPAGRRSGCFASASAFGMLLLSLTGQAWYHVITARKEVPPAGLVGFASALPVVVLALIAVLVHLRQADRERVAAEADANARALAQAEAAERAADERTVLRAELAAVREAHAAELGAERDARAAELQAAKEAHAAEADARIAAEQRAGAAETEAARLARKLAAQKPKGTRTAKPNAARSKRANEEPDTGVAAPFDAHDRAREIWTANPEISGKELGAAVGLGERWGQLRKNEFAAASRGADSAETSGPIR